MSSLETCLNIPLLKLYHFESLSQEIVLIFFNITKVIVEEVLGGYVLTTVEFYGQSLTLSFLNFFYSQCGVHADGPESGLGSAAGAQAGLRPQADAGSDRPQREAAAHVAHLLCGQPPTRRPHEGTVGGNDGT